MEGDEGIKAVRMISLFHKLMKGMAVNKKYEAERFSVSTKSIQRDIDDIRSYLESEGFGFDAVPYDRNKKGYVLNNKALSWLDAEELLTLSKILLESRSLVKDELKTLLDKLGSQCYPEQRQEVNAIIQNERHHYVAPRHNKRLFALVAEIARSVKDSVILNITYLRAGETKPVTYDVEPLGVVFSEFYFYLVAYIRGKGYEYPAVYRLDRILAYHGGRTQKEHFIIPHSKRFEEGEFRKQVQFMQTGELYNVRFRFWGKSLEAVLDRLPNAQVAEETPNGYILEAKVFGKGIKMWFLSQAEFLEVLKPDELRQDIRKTVQQLAAIYKD